MPATDFVRVAMSDFWKGYTMSGDSSVKEMMLDSRAEELNKEEKPEILSYLPDFSGQRVIELGAGIGRFTSEIASRAQSVVAVDFMKDFISKNEQTNKHLGNIQFLCADVTQLTREQESADLIFSNWLLMYLGDTEVQTLLTKLLTWLAPGGHLFIRESCRHASGDIKMERNPTEYRDPSLYEAFLASVTIPVDDHTVYGFDTVLSKSVDTYIKHKNNQNQVVWLMQKVARDTRKMKGFKNFQDFLDGQQYSLNSILRYEKVFGRTFISTGGLETTKEFIPMLKLQKGQRVLDVGGGIGGGAFYMAKEYGVQVVSIDLSTNMTRIALERAQEVGVSPHQVSFEVGDATKRNYAPHSFDVVYSRDTLLHIEDKLSLFQKFYRWLKPGGKVLISDYCCSEGPHSEHFKAYIQQRGYSLLSPPAYGKVLERAGFVGVRAEDRSHQFLQVLQRELRTMEDMRDNFVLEFSQQDYDHLVEGWQDKVSRVTGGEQAWGLFYAEKQQ